MTKKYLVLLLACILCGTLVFAGCSNASQEKTAEASKTKVTETEGTKAESVEMETAETERTEAETVETEAAETEVTEKEATEAEVSQADIDNSGSTMDNPWSGKRCVQLGDSITWYDGHTQKINGEPVPVKGYASYLRDIGLIVDNYGEDGACITNLSKYTDICETVTTIDFTQYDLVTITAGANDCIFWNAPIGDFADSDFNKGEFTQAYQFIIETILSQKANIRIILGTPLQEGYQKTANSQGKYLIDYANRIKEIGEYYGIPVMDLYGESGLNKANIAALTIDSLHPNNEGYKLICEHTFIPFVLGH